VFLIARFLIVPLVVLALFSSAAYSQAPTTTKSIRSVAGACAGPYQPQPGQWAIAPGGPICWQVQLNDVTGRATDLVMDDVPTSMTIDCAAFGGASAQVFPPACKGPNFAVTCTATSLTITGMAPNLGVPAGMCNAIFNTVAPADCTGNPTISNSASGTWTFPPPAAQQTATGSLDLTCIGGATSGGVQLIGSINPPGTLGCCRGTAHYNVLVTTPQLPPAGRDSTYIHLLPTSLGPATVTACWGTIGTDCYYDAPLHRIVVRWHATPQTDFPLVSYEAQPTCDVVSLTGDLCTQGELTYQSYPPDPTDGDPNTAGVQETCLRVTIPKFATSTKTIVDQNGGALQSGDVVNVTLQITNSGTVAATQVVVTDTIHAHAGPDCGMINPTNISSGGTYNAANRTITWNVASIPAGQTVSLTFSANVEGDSGDACCNKALITCAEYATCTPACQAETEEICPVLGQSPPQLTIAKTWVDDNGGELVPGSDRITGTITVNNAGGGDATQVVVTDTPDAVNLENITAQDGGTYTPPEITWPATTVRAGGSLVVHFTATVKCKVPGPTGTVDIPDSTRICNNTYKVESAETGVLNGTAPACLMVNRPVLTISKVVNAPNPTPGQNVDYTITVTNTGTGTANNIVVRDDVAAMLDTPPVMIGGGGTWIGPYIEWTVPSLGPAPASTQLTYTVTIGASATGNICNTNCRINAEAKYGRCAWTMPPVAPQACFIVGPTGKELHTQCCNPLPCQPTYPLPLERTVPDPPATITETGLRDLLNPICFHQIEVVTGNTVRVIKTGPTAPDEYKISY
jgi:uncharacterized repeat protein (TIGR01451 family)